MQTKRVQKMITFPVEVYERLEEKASILGLLVPEYLRHIVINHIEEVEYLSPRAEKRLMKISEDLQKDIDAGRVTPVSSGEELLKQLKNPHNERKKDRLQ